ncbi:MAG: hypothetical protein ACYC6N_18230 [Pirellulaceae bacterium]
MTVRHPSRSRRSGCGLLVIACGVACALLLVNRVLVLSLYLMLMPAALDHPKLRTLVVMLGIVALLIPEWWLIDLISARFARLRHGLRASQRNAQR